MNFSEPSAETDNVKAAIHSLQDWWATAGVDLDYAMEPAALLANPEEQNTPELKTELKSVSKSDSQQNVAETMDSNPASEDYPDQYVAFQDWLKEPTNLVEHDWAREFVYPDGCLQPDVMIISSMPEVGAIGNSKYFSDNEVLLLKNMLRAIGIDWDRSFRTAISLGRTIDARLTDGHIKPLINRTLHLISLVQPKRIIIFGDTASRAFFDEDLLSARKKKQFINHVSSKTEAIVTFHPRILLERPELKAETWKDLQMLTRIAAP